MSARHYSKGTGTMNSLTTAQATAVKALWAAHSAAVLRSQGERGKPMNITMAYVEASALDRQVSGSALRALVAKGIVQTSTSTGRVYGWDAPAYRLTSLGKVKAQTA